MKTCRPPRKRRGPDRAGHGPWTERDSERLTIDDFAVDERTGMVGCCPAGHLPLSCADDEQTSKTKLEMAAEPASNVRFGNSARSSTPTKDAMSWSTPTRSRLADRRGNKKPSLQATVRHAVGDRVDQQRSEEPPGAGKLRLAVGGASFVWSGTSWLAGTYCEPQLRRSSRVGSRADSKNTEKERNFVPLGRLLVLSSRDQLDIAGTFFDVLYGYRPTLSSDLFRPA